MDHPGPYENRSAHFMKDCYRFRKAFEKIVSRGSAQRISLKMRPLVIKRSIVLRALVVTMLLMGVFVIAPLVAHASSTTTYQTAVPASFASGVQNTNPGDSFNAISCASSGNCTVAGQFRDAAGNEEAFTQSETNGVWALSVPATFASGVQNANPNAIFWGISCVSAGNCTAAGYFKDVTGHNEAFTQSETNGVWALSVPATFTSGVQYANPSAVFYAISCASSGNCTAAGFFLDVSENYEAFTQSETNGVWALSVPATFTSGVQNASPDDTFSAISCASAGNCAAVGHFRDAAGYFEAFTQSETNGVWALSVPATFDVGVLNTNPNASFYDISCAAAGNCTAAGQFHDAAGHYEAFTESETNGVWALSVPASFASGVQSTNPSDEFTSISCASAGNCTAAGQFRDAAGNEEAFTQSETNGVWALSVPATFAVGVQNTNPSDQFNAISCASAGNCTAAGQFLDAAGNTEAFTQSETNGVWALSVPATFAVGVQNTNPSDQFNAISCASAGNCTAAGRFLDAAGNNEAFTQSLTTSLPVTTTTTPTTTPKLAATGSSSSQLLESAVVMTGLGIAVVLMSRRRKCCSLSDALR